MNTKRNKRSKQTTKSNPLKWIYVTGAIAAFLIIGTIVIWQFSLVGYRGDATWVYIPSGSSEKSISDSLNHSLGNDYGQRVYRLWTWMGGKPRTTEGAYKITNGMPAWKAARLMKKGVQTPIKLTFNNIRTIDQLAERLGGKMEWDSAAFINACDTILPKNGFTKPQYPAAFIPDSYEFYWNTPASKVVDRLLDYRNRYWNDERRGIARSMNLTPIQVATIASITEEETIKPDERPKVARLYLNRLDKGMKLQADPTVKFAVGDFSLRRITGKHLTVQSPYNTYMRPGLPPGPIRIPDKSALDAVLHAPRHNFIYMCAKEDFSGYHNFAMDYATHQQNARRYQAELNRKSIH